MRTRSMRFGLMLAAIVSVVTLLLGMAVAYNAHADTNASTDTAADDGYVMIGDVKVSKLIGISTQEELNDFRLSSIPKTFIIDPETGKDVVVELGIDGYSTPGQAKQVMDGTLTLDELDEAFEARQEKSVAAVKPVTLYQKNGITTTFKESGVHYGNWPNSIQWDTGSWYASADFTYKGTHSNTGVRGPHSYAGFVQGNTVTVTAVYMNR